MLRLLECVSPLFPFCVEGFHFYPSGWDCDRSGSNVLFNNVVIGTIDSVQKGHGGEPLDIHFNSNITLDAISQLMLDVTYSHQTTPLTADRVAVYSPCKITPSIATMLP